MRPGDEVAVDPLEQHVPFRLGAVVAIDTEILEERPHRFSE